MLGEVVKAAEEAGIRDKVTIMVGGAPVNQAFADSINADIYTEDAASAKQTQQQSNIRRLIQSRFSYWIFHRIFITTESNFGRCCPHARPWAIIIFYFFTY